MRRRPDARGRAAGLALAGAAMLGAGGLAGGCASTPGEAAPKVATPHPAPFGGGGYLYSLPEMQAARAHREGGARELQRAYRSRRQVDRQAHYQQAWEAFLASLDAYHAALVTAHARYRTVIESEAATVAGYMRQIQRDRELPTESFRDADMVLTRDRRTTAP